MRAMIVGVALVYALLTGVTLYEEHWMLFRYLETRLPVGGLVLTACVVPVLASWGVAECLAWRWRVRMLDRRLGARSATQAGAGVVIGVTGVILGLLLLTALDRALPDVLLMGIASAAATAAVLLPLKRQAPGCCPKCGYDVGGATPAGGGKCTECGFDLMGGRLSA